MIKSQVKSMVTENMQSEQTQKTNLEVSTHAGEKVAVSNHFQTTLAFI